MALLHQLGAQFHHQHLLRQRLEGLLQEGRIIDEEVVPLLAGLEDTSADIRA